MPKLLSEPHLCQVMKIIVVSQKDIAAMNIKKILLNEFDFKETDEEFDNNKIFAREEYILVTVKKDSIFNNHLDEKFDPEIYIFASRHSSKSELPCLTVHVTGNYSDNKFGGNQKELCLAPSKVICGILKNLEENKIDGFEVCLEVSHHGPTDLKSPLIFVEVGSTKEQWNNLGACRTVAKTIMEFKEKGESAIAFGGPHYAPKFTKLVLQGWAIGHICPKYQFEHFDEKMFDQMIKKTTPEPRTILIDKKGTKGKMKNLLKELSKKHDLDVKLV